MVTKAGIGTGRCRRASPSADGERGVAATLLSRAAVPVLYYLVARRGSAAELQQ